MMPVHFNDVQLKLDNGNTLSMTQHISDDHKDIGYSRVGVTVEVLVENEKHEQVHHEGWVGPTRLAEIIREHGT